MNNNAMIQERGVLR